MEILRVLVVVGIMTALAMPLILGNMESYRVRVAAWEMAGDLRLARQRAVSLQKRHRICLSTCGSCVPTGGYLLEREEGGAWVVDLVRTDIPNGVDLTTTAPFGKLTFGSKGEVWGASGT
ncbi:MAG: GspH/FimT family pseudopilin, partial [candidate division NC10 bacterium]